MRFLWVVAICLFALNCSKNNRGAQRGEPLACRCMDNEIFAFERGICSAEPQRTCPQVSQPVCGCDGRSHLNSCEAANHGITAWAIGSCTERTPVPVPIPVPTPVPSPSPVPVPQPSPSPRPSPTPAPGTIVATDERAERLYALIKESGIEPACSAGLCKADASRVDCSQTVSETSSYECLVEALDGGSRTASPVVSKVFYETFVSLGLEENCIPGRCVLGATQLSCSYGQAEGATRCTLSPRQGLLPEPALPRPSP